jgi:hypothetical protein
MITVKNATSKDTTKGMLKSYNTALDNGIDHTEYFLRNILHFKFINREQARIIDALSPTWKGLLMNRLYHMVEWKTMTLRLIFNPRNGVFNEDNEESEGEFFIEDELDGEVIPWDEFEEEKTCFEEDIKKAKNLSKYKKQGKIRNCDDKEKRYRESMKNKQQLTNMTRNEFTVRQRAYGAKIIKQIENYQREECYPRSTPRN